jgi:hypothetical protein
MKQEEQQQPIESKLSRREYFAGQALRGLLANPNSNIDSEMIAEVAIIYAESLIKEFDKTIINEENLKRIYGTHPKKDDR